MAAPRLLSLSRTLFTTTTAAPTAAKTQTLTSLLLSRSLSATASTPATILRLRPLASAVSLLQNTSALRSTTSFRTFATRQNQNSLSDNNPNWSNRPPKETILLDGCDFEHWLVITDTPPEGTTRDEIIDSYIKTLAQVIGSEEEARMKIYSVSTRHYFGFGALVNEELSLKLKELPNVRWVLPDSYLDVRNKDYGGEPFIDGQAVPYDPKYHEEWVRNNAKAQERNRRNDRPRNADRSRNFDRRQGGRPQNYQNNPAPGGPGGNMGGPSPNNAGYAQNAPPNNAGYGQNMPPPNNAGYGQNMPPPSNAGYGHGQNMPPPSNAGYGHGQNMPPPNNAGYGQTMPQGNPGYAQNRGPPPNYGGQGNPGQYQTGGGMPYQNTQSYAPQNSNMGGQQDPRGAYQQNVPGRDGPNHQ